MASGYDLTSRNPFRLMAGRLGLYDKKPYEPSKTDPEMSGINDQSTRLRVGGGNLQQERMIKNKRRSLDKAVWYSYQAAEIVREDAEDRRPVRALINPDKLKQDYDDKILSVGYEYNFKAGDIFEWLGTKSHWLVYLQDLTELSYFRSEIRRCSYQIQWQDEDGLHSTWAAIRGPVETKINYIQKHEISVDTPNYSLNILMPQNEETLKHFKRYQKFYLQDEQNGVDKVCWRVEAIDWISIPGVLEVNATEYYVNEIEDDLELGLPGGLLLVPENPNDDETEENIVGETFIKPKKFYEYTFNGNSYQDWVIDQKYPVTIEEDPKDSRHVALRWDSSYSGQFELSYGAYTKVIVVESLF